MSAPAARVACLLFAALPFVVSASPQTQPAPGTVPSAADRLERLDRMSPQERARALAGLPPARRAQIESQLDRLDRLSPPERARLLDRLRRLQQMSPLQKEEARSALRQLRELPPGRRAAVRRELNFLRGLPPGARERRLDSDRVTRRFSPLEFSILERSSTLLPGPF